MPRITWKPIRVLERGKLSPFIPAQEYGRYRRSLPYGLRIGDDREWVSIFNRDYLPMFTRYPDGRVVRGGSYSCAVMQHFCEDDGEFHSFPIEYMEAWVFEFWKVDSMFDRAFRRAAP
jgi:hypothetical protein